MELRQFAENLLFAESLEAKLAGPEGRISDDQPGLAVTTPPVPGRPDTLRFRDGKDARADFPKAHELEDEGQRGLLLHFFANHELLATELMALVLLKFPDAPAEFRRGVYRTLREEQEHTRLYLERMAACGVKFGDYPVSGFFWKSVAPMESPLDYVTRLSLTFEQANLDFSRHFAGVFRRSGDEATASLLDRIYRDEIGHVRYGLEWFRRWKDGSDSDWDAFQRQLIFPLSPRRAKAGGEAPFNREGRLEAGLDEAFIRELGTFERSKGRTPRVFCFNPDAEAAMASGLEGKGYAPRKTVEALAEDLEILPAFLSRLDDVVLMRELPGLEYRERLRAWGFELPEFVALPGTELRERKLRELCPWAWCPPSHRWLQPFAKNLPAAATGSLWKPEVRSLFSKAQSVAWLREFMDSAIVGRVAHTLEEVEHWVANFPAPVVLKAPFGASGQRNQVWTGPKLVTWAQGVLDREGAIVVEPWLERVFDFSMQYEIDDNGSIRRLAGIRLGNDARGQFRYAQCGPKLGQGLPDEVARLLNEVALPLMNGPLPDFLSPRLAAAGYRGPFGVDAFIYRMPEGTLGLKPLVELNPRYTMGRLAWELRRRVASGKCVRFELVPVAAQPEERVEFSPDGRLTRGTLVLNDATRAKHVFAVLHVADRHDAFPE